MVMEEQTTIIISIIIILGGVLNQDPRQEFSFRTGIGDDRDEIQEPVMALNGRLQY